MRTTPRVRPTVRLACLAGLAAITLLAGCNAPRALPSVRELGDRAYRDGDYATAASHYEEYVLRKPGDEGVEHQYALTLIQLDRPVEAIEHASIAYNRRPDVPMYADTLAEAYFRAGKTEQLARFLDSHTQGRGLVSDYIRSGQFAARQGDADGAEQALQMAAKIDGGQTVEPQLALANFYRTIGAKEKERQRLRMVLGINPMNPDANRRLREMGEVPGPSLALPPAERGVAPIASPSR